MALIDEVKRLKALESKSTPGKWFVEETIQQWDLYAQNHALDRNIPENHKDELVSCFGAHPWKLISANKNGYWPSEDDSELIPLLRNAAPWLLAVAGQFQAGDASLLDELIEYIDFLIPSGLEAVEEGDEEFEVIPDDQKLLIKAKDCLRRMRAAAKIMEGQG